MMDAFYENRRAHFSAGDNRHDRRRLGYAAHLHQHIELVLMTKGHTVAFADSKQYEIESGDAFIAFPNQIHRYESSGCEKFLILIVDPNLMPPLADVFEGKMPRENLVKGIVKEGELLHLAERLVEIRHDEGKYATSMLQGYLLAFFSLFLSHVELVEVSAGDSQTLKAIISYCMKHHQEELSLAVLERELHMSRYYISHLFSDKLMIGFNQYVNSLRVTFACNHLRYSDKPITEVANLVGFNTLRTFNRAFIKQTGMTPSGYRTNMKLK